jgi:hypothetical protein
VTIHVQKVRFKHVGRPSDMVKAAAEKTGYHASTIRSVIAALASDDFEDKKGKAEQLSLAFEALA